MTAGTKNVQEELLQQVIDPCLTDDVLSALATEALGTETRCNGYSILTGGSWSRVIDVPTNGAGQHLVFKITPQIGNAALQREFQVMQHFRDCTSMPVPEPYLLDLTGERIKGSVLVMERMRGTVLSEANKDLTDEERRCIAVEIIDHLVDLHAHEATGFGGVELPSERRSATWMEFWVPRFDVAIARTQEKGLMPDDVMAGIGELRGDLSRILDVGPCGTLIHYDVWTGNVMVDDVNGRPRVTGFLDINGYYADYARELASMFSLADVHFMQVYGQRHGFDEGFAARFGLYSLSMCLQLFCMYPSATGYMDSARRYLRQVQTYVDSH